MNKKLLLSKEIIERAIAEYKPYAIALMLSGGDDSMTALTVAKMLQVPITHIIHGVTGTGIQETQDFVRKTVLKEKPIYLEADAGDAYINYVMRKGFFGKGAHAHNYSYNVLKLNHFKSCVSKNIRQRTVGRNVLFVNGARRSESKRREVTMINPIRFTTNYPHNIWVNIINDWSKEECIALLAGESIERNPVSKELCRSGECMCGTMQTETDRIEASLIYPKWGAWIDGLEKVVLQKHGFGWGENMPKKKQDAVAEIKIDAFQPMCIGCEARYDDNKHLH